MGGISADGKVFWVSGRYNGVVYAISTPPGRRSHEIPVGARPARPVRLPAARPLLPRPHRHLPLRPTLATRLARRRSGCAGQVPTGCFCRRLTVRWGDLMRPCLLSSVGLDRAPSEARVPPCPSPAGREGSASGRSTPLMSVVDSSLSLRSHVALEVGRATNVLSRRLGLGDGTTIGGVTALALEPCLAAGSAVPAVLWSWSLEPMARRRQPGCSLHSGRPGSAWPATRAEPTCPPPTLSRLRMTRPRVPPCSRLTKATFGPYAEPSRRRRS